MSNYIELDKNFNVEKINDEEFNFYPYTAFKLEGFPWYETDKKLYRLPLDVMSKIEGNIVTLAKSSAGGCIRFKSNTNKIALKVTYERRRHSPGMPQVSDAGFDIYVKKGNEWVFINMFRPEIADEELNMTRELFSDGGMNEYALYFPLYSCPDEISIGFEVNSTVSADVDPRNIEKPILFYGSSVTNGGCVARAANTYSATVGRKLDAPIINMGYSGSCRGETEIAEAISKLDLAMFVSEFDHNMKAPEELYHKLTNFISIIRDKNPNLPIILMSRPFFVEYRREFTEQMLQIVKKVHNEMLQKGDKNIYFISGMDIFDMDDRYDYSIDGVHPTDLGNRVMGMKLVEFTKKNKIF